MNLKLLHEQFIEQANRPMTFGALPVSPKDAEAPVIAVDRWKIVDGVLTKPYKFRRIEDRDSFVMALLSYEREVQHNAIITIDHDSVGLRLVTKDVDRVTELDKEYARYADVLFRDLVYSLGHGTETQPNSRPDE